MAKSADITPKPGKKINVNDYDPGDVTNVKRDEVERETEVLRLKLIELQEKLYAQQKYALLVVLQAMDTGGKDGTIRKVFSGVNPQGVSIVGFKAPTTEELAHDFLWRVHQNTPAKGYITIFNRSHYEDVLVVRVEKLVPEKVWRSRYERINEFEQHLAESGTTILKFFLNISKDEQRERLQERLDDPTKHWKFSIGDLAVREKWSDYMKVYSDAISECNTEYAPWIIVPANKKWYRNYIVVKHIVEALEKMPLAYPEPEEGLDKVVIPE